MKKRKEVFVLDKRAFLDELFARIQNLSVSSILSTRIHLSRSGQHHFGYCPFHDDRKKGSFVSTDSMKIWKCFSCGTGGDGVKFISEYDGISYLEAAFRIGLEFGLISQYDYDEFYSSKRYGKEEIQEIQRKNERVIKRSNRKIASPKLLNGVYKLFIEMAGLSDEHKKYLIKERSLSEQEIENGKYFTFPTRRIMRSLLNEIRNHFGTTDILKEIPGFYYDKKENKWTFSKMKGIGIPIRDIHGHVVGIQVRLDNKKTKDANRYFWFSSSFAVDEQEHCKYGTSSGAPIDIIVPDTIKNQTIIITEGRFKSEVLSKDTGSVTFSVQGVTTWRGILEAVESLSGAELIESKFPNYQAKVILVAFDADLSENIAVFEQLRKMTDQLASKNMPILYLYWDQQYGKGIDDVILSGNRHQIKTYNKKEWDMNYEKMIKQIILETETSKEKLMKLPKELILNYFHNHFINKIEPVSKKKRLVSESKGA